MTNKAEPAVIRWRCHNGQMDMGSERRGTDVYAALCWHVRDAMALDAAGARGSWGYVWTREDEE